jgi:N-methylhydantoinase A
VSAVAYQIGIDVGGTFTDLVASDGQSHVISAKTPTTPDDEAAGILAGLDQLADRFSVARPDLLQATEVIVLGTTIATNTMLEYNGAVTGLICTRGFRDIIELRRSYRENLFDLAYPPPVPICRRQRRIGVTERIDYAGEVVIPLDEEELRLGARKLRRLDVTAVAVCFLFSHVNPAHELRAREILQEEVPDCDITLSCEVFPEIREFERVSTILVNAYTLPRFRTYLERIKQILANSGFDVARLLIVQSNGGVLPVASAAERSVAAVRSGPASGMVAAAHVGEICNARNVIGVDMGGTSYDVSLVRGGIPQVRKDAWVGRYRVALPMLDIHAIGAGGGSIGWLDRAGALHVGPRSAGANPGPACYGRGGQEPTVTDADLVLGYLNPTYFLNGQLRLDPELARRSINEKLAAPMSCDVFEAAVGVLRMVNNNMNNGVRYVSIARGHDPRDFALMAFGGAGAVHVGMQAQDLGISRVLVPKDASVFCAVGALISDLKISLTQAFFSRASELDLQTLNGAFATLDDRAREALTHDSASGVACARFVDIRYIGQAHEVTVPIDAHSEAIDTADFRAAVTRFHDLHESLYAFKNPENEVEILNIRYDLIGMRGTDNRAWSRAHRSIRSEDAIAGSRTAFFETNGSFAPLDTPVFAGERLDPGSTVSGPAIIEEPFTTIVLCPGQTALLNEHRVYDIEVSPALGAAA